MHTCKTPQSGYIILYIKVTDIWWKTLSVSTLIHSHRCKHRVLLAEKRCTAISDVVIISPSEFTNTGKASNLSKKEIFSLISFQSSPLPWGGLTVTLDTIFEAVHYIHSVKLSYVIKNPSRSTLKLSNKGINVDLSLYIDGLHKIIIPVKRNEKKSAKE